jgi:hypothetical protein
MEGLECGLVESIVAPVEAAVIARIGLVCVKICVKASFPRKSVLC